MKLSDFHYPLPDELIAQFPTQSRSASRLLVLDRHSGALQDQTFTDLIAQLDPGDVLVMNNTRVIPARMYGHKASGGRLEVLVERVLDRHNLLAQVRASKAPRPGSRIQLGDRYTAQVDERVGDFYRLRFDTQVDVLAMMSDIGHMPLPPYIDRTDEANDATRYQTVYAQHDGAVAAPTAGLHFDQALLDALSEKGVQQAFVTLHVGAGTFQPVRVENIADHKMHHEWLQVPPATVDLILETKARGRRVIAVGTTSVRSLESAAQSGVLQPFEGETDIFITPGFEFRVIDGLITNFHLPESTLLMLVSAFAGHQPTMQAYRHAVEQRYRFFSYGDAMLIR